MNRIYALVWPQIADQQTARLAARRSSVFLYAFMILGLANNFLQNGSFQLLFIAISIGLLIWGIRRMSRIIAIYFLIVFGVLGGLEFLKSYMEEQLNGVGPPDSDLIVLLKLTLVSIVLLACINLVRGTFAYWDFPSLERDSREQ